MRDALEGSSLGTGRPARQEVLGNKEEVESGPTEVAHQVKDQADPPGQASPGFWMRNRHVWLSRGSRLGGTGSLHTARKAGAQLSKCVGTRGSCAARNPS